MIERLDPSRLEPAQKASLIYTAARASLADSLWQAALGNGRTAAAGEGKPDRSNVQGLSLDSLLTLLAGENGEEFRPADEVRQAEQPAARPMMAEGAEVTPGGLGANADLEGHLTAAAQRTGIPSAVLAAIVDAEAAKDPDGRWRVYSRNPRSSAAGLGQFLSGSWETLAEKPGTWLNGVAEANGWLNEHGHVKGKARSALLELRYDPAASIQATADYARDNLDRLRAAGVSLDGDAQAIARAAYLGHHLGAGDAIKFLTGNIGAGRARHLLDAQIGHEAANRRIAESGDATAAHRAWLLGFVDRNVRPERFAMVGNGLSSRAA